MPLKLFGENMKKLLLSLFTLAMVLPAHAFIGNINYSTGQDYAGVIVPSSVEKIFINIKANGAIVAGNVVSADLTADDGATGVIGPITGLAPLCIATAAIADGAIGKCQTYGISEVALYDATNISSATAGQRGYMSTVNAGYIQARDTELATEIPLGYFYDASTASGAVQFFIQL